jgi:hypothetical protein
MKKLFGKKDSGTEDGGYVLLAWFPEMWQADLAVSLLVSEGIQAWSADDRFINGTDHATDRGGAGVMVQEADAMSAWHILQMAERGEFSLQEEAPAYPDEWNRRKREDREKSSQRIENKTRNLEPETRNLYSVRCPRCGSENNEKRKGIRALFSPGYHCRVCHWEWRKS